MVKLVETGSMGDVREDDWSVIDKPAGGNRSGKRVFDGSVSCSGAHAVLLPRVGSFRILRGTGTDKQCQRSGQDCDETGSQSGMKSKLTGNQSWHEPPTASSSR